MVKKNLIPIFIFLSILGYSKEITVEKIIARINDKPITLSTFEQFYKTIVNYQNNIDKQRALNMLIDRELLLQIAKEYNIEVSSKEINKEISKIKSKNKDIKKEDEHYLKYEVSLNKNKENLIRHIVKNNFVRKPDDKEIRQIYEENKEQFYEKEKLLVSHILIKLSRDDSYEELENKENLIKDILTLAKNKKEKFSSLAKKYSDDINTKYKGGLIGWHDINSLKEIQPDIASSATELKVGEISDIIISASGYHIIKIINKKEERQISFYEAKQFIINKILVQKANRYLAKMIDNKRKQSYIEQYL